MKINIGFKKGVAALRAALAPRGLANQQTLARTVQGNTLNYQAIATLDPARVAVAFAQAEQGHITDQARLFEMIEERDAHIYTELNKRRLAVTGLKWQLQPPRDANQSELDRVVELADILAEIDNFEDAQFDMTDAIGKGFCAHEFHWQTGETWRPAQIEFVPQRYFHIDPASNQLQYMNMGIPEPLRPLGWLVHEHRAKSGYMEQTALFRVLTWLYAFKAYDWKDMNRFTEVYGLPLRLGKYPAGTLPEQRKELLRAVRNIGNDGAGIIPSNMVIDFVQATKTGTVDDFLKAIRYWEEKQSGAILGGNIDGQSTTETRMMLYDQGRTEILLHDVKQMEPTYSKGLLKPICLVNGLFPENRLPRWKIVTEKAADQEKVVKVLDTAASLGMEIDVDWAHQELQIPRAKTGAAILGKASTKPSPAALRAALTKAPLSYTPTIADAYAQQLTAACIGHEQAIIEKIAAAVAEAGDFETALDGLMTLNQQSINPEYIKILAEGMMAANLAGRAEVPSE